MSFNVGKKLLVLGSNEALDSKERIPIVLGPGRAFGSGDHETTRSCLEELENIPSSLLKKVLDLGCGTGILSIAAAKLGARSVTAIDPNPFAVETTIANVKLNSSEEQIHVIRGELKDIKGMRFDLIMANLYGDVLQDLVNEIPLFLNPGGYLMLSGIHYEYHYELKTGFIEMGLALLKNRMLEEYTTLIFKKGP
jgi:ribosomal protein L11 methyltransferase